ncbi:hypothetical protein A2526_01005 [candidate division WOR-1 bacterium RIFOXYD2_FULL_36_8]|uniref:Uncharacterized protein n=1 Tax=candidate division WOR-1 bacterium RIFOXYB2_FULL_36_35 TaxID=1802578 RepID=A0A1F4S2S4_UNCSA|nr:MAG: hypothetical protein A2230_07625 [candidate division WOR-1 bacterium RIFOXYA2_FULL_36_21]OGC14744.1 MAG: hypothetical protein A2290_08620 [candidate division WOR-1 bacterium RIFOXYB2_FULL_36_35]OGC15472.1 MAG: hypothetical protein A2282_07800 [candidate division WOR-1 bacterium RIFOXYA12_FULL_36_13]OGC38035.1 MAG: hypothetical protein A2526_01005 [candidate division WOR-1 bacterium RIFOXYD2_FULL_36_8]
MAGKKGVYKVAYEGLQVIFNELREGNIEVDDLEVKLKKALEYIKTCKEILKKQETKVTDILKEIKDEG